MVWVEVAEAGTLEDGQVVGVEKKGFQLAVYRLGNEYFATSNICTHQFAFLSEGYVAADCIECPLHQGLFNIRTGEVEGGPVEIDLKTFPTKIDGGRVLVRLDSEAN